VSNYNNLGLLRNDGIEGGTSGGGERIPEPPDRWVLEHPVDGCGVQRDPGVVHLRVLSQEAVDHRDTDAGADVPR
jgi:hypothetical protein